jgi:hypothetical protein
MKVWRSFTDRLRGLHRGYKFAILLIAAWAPFLFPENPAAGGIVMATMTALFFLVTTKKPVPATGSSLAEKSDV